MWNTYSRDLQEYDPQFEVLDRVRDELSIRYINENVAGKLDVMHYAYSNIKG